MANKENMFSRISELRECKQARMQARMKQTLQQKASKEADEPRIMMTLPLSGFYVNYEL